MANNSAVVRELRRKPGSVRSMFAREAIGYSSDHQLLAQGIQEKDQQNSEVIVANVFGTVPPKQPPPTDSLDYMHSIVGDQQISDNESNTIVGAIIGWTEMSFISSTDSQLPAKVILLDNSTVKHHQQQQRPTAVTALYADSLFPIVMANDYKPLDTRPKDYTYATYLYLNRCPEIPVETRRVRFVSVDNQEIQCQTYAAQLQCVIKMGEKYQYRNVMRILDVNSLSYQVKGLYAPTNTLGDTHRRVSMDFMSDLSIRYPDLRKCFADRTVYLVANDGLLCVTEMSSLKDDVWLTSLLKSETYCVCEGVALIDSSKEYQSHSTRGLFKGLPYIEFIVIVGEGVNNLLIKRSYLTILAGHSYVISNFSQSDLSVNIVYIDCQQLFADLESYPSHTGSAGGGGQLQLQRSIRPVMPLADIGDYFVVHYRDKGNQIGDIVFSFRQNYITDREYVDEWNVFICLDDRQPQTADYQYCLQLAAKYGRQKYCRRQLDPPNIFFYDRANPYVRAPVLSDQLTQHWTTGGQRKIVPFRNKALIANDFLPQFHYTDINRFGNIGVNLMNRYRIIQENDYRFPIKQTKEQLAEQLENRKRQRKSYRY